MEISFNKGCIKKALEHLENLTDYKSFTILIDLQNIDKELNNPFADIKKLGLLDAKLRNKYFYIIDFEKYLKNYAFLFNSKEKIKKFSFDYYLNHLKIDYYAIIGYVLLKYSLINNIEEYICNENINKVIIKE